MIVLDTHALVWWVSGGQSLSKNATRAIRRELADEGAVLVSSISVWEMAMLIKKGRLVLSMPLERWLDQVSRIEGLRFVPLDNAICLASTALPGNFHKDPADRMIVATARHFAAPLLTADEKILHYQHVRTLW